ncbi:MAG: hypothetical protein NW208_16040 [Bryobacter sp.]|nr:hypothetical protein [Bryobacter sp.]
MFYELADTHFMELQSIGLAGLEKAQEKLQQSARRLASIGSPVGNTGGNPAALAYAGGALAAPIQDQVDLSAELVSLKEAELLAEANLKVVETANELSSRVLDVLA